MRRALARFRTVVAAAACAVALSCSGEPTVGEVAALRFLAQPTGIVAGTPFTVAVELTTASGQRVTSATDAVTIALAGAQTLTGTTTVNATNGVATFSGLVLTRAGSSFHLDVSRGSATAESDAFSVAAGPVSAAHSSVQTTVPSVLEDVAFDATFTFRDEFDNPIAGVAVSLASTLGGVTFTPSSGTTNASGQFTTTIQATAPGSAAVRATVAGLSFTIGAPIVVNPGATGLRFASSPSDVVAGQPFAATVEFITATGQRATAVTGTVTLSLASGSISGTTSGVATQGLASFSGVTLTTAGNGITINASSSGLTGTSGPINVAPGVLSLTQSSLVSSPSLARGVASQSTFTLKDAFGNLIPLTAVTIATAIANTTIAPSSGSTSAVGTFVTTITPGTAGAGTITATTAGSQIAFPVTVRIPGACNFGTLAIGTPVSGTILPNNGCVLNNHAAAAFSMAIGGGGPATVVELVGTSPQGGIFPEIAITADPPTSSLLVFGNSGSPSSTTRQEYLLPGGAFLAWIASVDGATGAYSLSATASGSGAPGCKPRALVDIDATYTGQSLASSDCVDATGPYYIDVFSVFDSRPCTITLRAGFDAWLEIRDAGGGLVTSDDESGGGSDARITLPACTLGNGAPVNIWASSFQTATSGAYTLSVTFSGSAGAASALRASPLQTVTIPPGALRVKRAK